jgi:hypothetical protein
VLDAGRGLAFERAKLRPNLLDAALRVLDGRGRRALTDGDFGAGRVEHADALVGELAVGDEAVREAHRVFDGFFEHAHPVVALKVRGESAHHHDGLLLGRLLDLDDLKAAREGRVFLEVLLVLGPRRRGDGAQLAARQRGLEEVGGVVLPRLPARAYHRVRLVDEEDDGARRGLHLLDDAFEAVLELALNPRAGLQEREVERAD